MPYYAVKNGRQAGVYSNWNDCNQQVHGYSNARFQKFDSAAEANAFVNSGQSSSSSSYGYGGGSYSSGMSSSSSRSSASSYDSEGYRKVYTDGACRNNGYEGASAGIGVYWGSGNSMNVSEKLEGRQTNNRAEITAATKAIEQGREHGFNKLAINTDSEFMIKGATRWMPNWKENDWKTSTGEPVKNEADFKNLDRAAQGMDLKWVHVDAHSGNKGNEAADRLARGACGKN